MPIKCHQCTLNQTVSVVAQQRPVAFKVVNPKRNGGVARHSCRMHLAAVVGYVSLHGEVVEVTNLV